MRPRVGWTVGPSSRLDRIERRTDGPVADRVEMRLEPERIERRDPARPGPPGRSGAGPGCPSGTRRRSRYGSSIAPVKFSRTPSIISLTLVGAYRPIDVARRRLDQLLDLLGAAVMLPPQGAHHATRQLAAGGQRHVRTLLVVRLDDRVLPGGDPEPVEVPLAKAEGFLEVSRRVVRAATGRPGPSRLPGGCRSPFRPRRARSVRRTDPVSWRSRPASSSALVFTQALWPSRLVRKAGRSGRIRSSSSRRGVPPSNAAMYQPPPRIHASSGCDRAYASITSISDPVCASAWRSHRSIASPPWTGWTCASWNPGVTVRPRNSMTRVRGPIRSATIASGPTATSRPSRTARAVAHDRAASIVAIRPPRRTRSAGWSVVIVRSLRASHPAPRPHPTRRDGVASPAMTSVHLLHAGYIGRADGLVHRARARRRRADRRRSGDGRPALADPRPARRDGCRPRRP